MSHNLLRVKYGDLLNSLRGAQLQIPYEVVYAIEKAAKDWGTSNILITTAIIQEANFYFHSSNRDFFDSIEIELGIKINYQPVQIALPYIYRHKPLFCVPLFHEFGHFVDTDNGIVTISLLNSSEDVGPDLPDVKASSEIAKLSGREREYWKSVVMMHRKEYFADLVGVAYRHLRLDPRLHLGTDAVLVPSVLAAGAMQ